MGKNKNLSIPNPKIKEDYKLVFSFEFYDTSEDFCLSKFKREDVKKALERLRQLNCKTLDEIFRQKKVLHFHEVDWNKTIKKSGFPSTMANQLSPFQFSLLGINNQKARVYGAYQNNIFYIVWFDLDHEIWPTFLKNT